MICKRCGIPFGFDARTKRNLKNEIEENCNDCNAQPMKQITKKGEWCYPYPGDVDDQFRPLNKDGTLHLPGIRTCGNKDCTRKRHIQSFDPLEMERLDISYRTGKKFSDKQSLEELA